MAGFGLDPFGVTPFGVGAGGCEWPVDYADCGPCDALASMPVSGQERVEEMATEFLWRWTERQFGTCEGTIRPCRQDCTEGVSTYGRPPAGARWTPVLVGGTWYNLGCGAGCRDKCGCGSWGSTMLFEQPVYDVTSVQVDGEYLDPSAYRVDNHRKLVRQDGGRWPFCQDMGKPLGGPDTWAVTFLVGSPVPVGGQVAAGKLACEFAKALCGDASCALPKRVQSVTRQGVTVAMMLDTFEDLDQGKTGIWLVDSWVASVTKSAPASPFSIASPDYTGPRRTTSGG